MTSYNYTQTFSTIQKLAYTLKTSNLARLIADDTLVSTVSK